MKYDLLVEVGSLCWEKTSFAKALLSPSTLPLQKVAACQCKLLSYPLPRCNGHVITRDWANLPGCEGMRELGVDSSFHCHTYPSLQRICGSFSRRLERFFRLAGFTGEHLLTACQQISAATERLLSPWLAALPAVMKQEKFSSAPTVVTWAGRRTCRSKSWASDRNVP